MRNLPIRTQEIEKTFSDIHLTRCHHARAWLFFLKSPLWCRKQKIYIDDKWTKNVRNKWVRSSIRKKRSSDFSQTYRFCERFAFLCSPGIFFQNITFPFLFSISRCSNLGVSDRISSIFWKIQCACFISECWQKCTTSNSAILPNDISPELCRWPSRRSHQAQMRIRTKMSDFVLKTVRDFERNQQKFVNSSIYFCVYSGVIERCPSRLLWYTVYSFGNIFFRWKIWRFSVRNIQ